MIAPSTVSPQTAAIVAWPVPRRTLAGRPETATAGAPGTGQPTCTDRHGGPTIPVSGPPETPRRNGANAPAMTVGAVSVGSPEPASEAPDTETVVAPGASPNGTRRRLSCPAASGRPLALSASAPAPPLTPASS